MFKFFLKKIQGFEFQYGKYKDLLLYLPFLFYFFANIILLGDLYIYI